MPLDAYASWDSAWRPSLRQRWSIVISSSERASARIIGCKAIPSPRSTRGDAVRDASRVHGSDTWMCASDVTFGLWTVDLMTGLWDDFE